MTRTRTTLHLREDLRRRLKELAARRGTTLSALLVEGAEIVLARHRGDADREELRRRARAAARELRNGLYDGASLARDADRAVYPPPGEPGPDEPR